jgi:hypothetical protein
LCGAGAQSTKSPYAGRRNLLGVKQRLMNEALTLK